MPSTGIALIASERVRQIAGEGFTHAHDDAHTDGSIELAAECYIHYGGEIHRYPAGMPPSLWPWEAKAWKPSEDHTLNLIKAGALIAAEIDRIARQRDPA